MLIIHLFGRWLVPTILKRREQLVSVFGQNTTIVDKTVNLLLCSVAIAQINLKAFQMCRQGSGVNDAILEILRDVVKRHGLGLTGQFRAESES